ncbi:MAG: hypothetical protein ACRC57_07400 [Sarcina sp.]
MLELHFNGNIFNVLIAHINLIFLILAAFSFGTFITNVIMNKFLGTKEIGSIVSFCILPLDYHFVTTNNLDLLILITIIEYIIIKIITKIIIGYSHRHNWYTKLTVIQKSNFYRELYKSRAISTKEYEYLLTNIAN